MARPDFLRIDYISFELRLFTLLHRGARYCILVVASGRVSIASSRAASLPLKLTKIAPSSSFRRCQKDGLGGDGIGDVITWQRFARPVA